MIISQTPLRLSFFGGGTDYPEHFLKHGGAVLASAIDKFSYITASRFPSRLFDYKVRVSYRKVELVRAVTELEHRVYQACLQHCGLEQDIELHNIADLPSFSGLGSSSAFTVGLLKALHAFKGEDLAPLDLAYEAIHIERDVLHENVGCQDQLLAAVGGFNLVEFHRPDHIAVHPVNLPLARLHELEAHLLLVYTKITRRASDIVAAQLQRVDANAERLLEMRRMVDRGLEILRGATDILEFGRLLHLAWQLKARLSQTVSNETIDHLYQLGLNHGAVGGKLLGAGGGGFILFFAPPEAHPRLRAVFQDYEIIEVNLNAPGSNIIFKL